MHRGQHLTAPNQLGSMSMHRDQDLTAPNQLNNISTHEINSDQLKNNKNGNKPRILPFGAIWQIRDLCLNKKKNKRKYRKNLHMHLLKQTGVNHKNLKEVNYDDRDREDPIKYLRIGTVNTDSIKNKQEIVLEAINRYHLDLLVVTELGLKTQTKIKYGYSHQK